MIEPRGEVLPRPSWGISGEAGAGWVLRPHNAYPTSLIPPAFVPICLGAGAAETGASPDGPHQHPLRRFRRAARPARLGGQDCPPALRTFLFK